MKTTLSLWLRTMRDRWETNGRRQRASWLPDSWSCLWKPEKQEMGSVFQTRGGLEQQVTALPAHSIFIILFSLLFLPSPFRSRIKFWSYHMREQYRRREKRDEGQRRIRRREKLHLFGHKTLQAKRSHCKTWSFFNQPTAEKRSKTEKCEEAGMLNLGTWGEIKE